jgi:hypothetical protein
VASWGLSATSWANSLSRNSVNRALSACCGAVWAIAAVGAKPTAPIVPRLSANAAKLHPTNLLRIVSPPKLKPRPSANQRRGYFAFSLATHSWTRMSSTDSGSEPEAMTMSLKPLMSNFAPSAFDASARKATMRIMPIL